MVGVADAMVVGIGEAGGVVMVVDGRQFVQAVAQDGDAAVDGEQAEGQQLSRRKSHGISSKAVDKIDRSLRTCLKSHFSQP